MLVGRAFGGTVDIGCPSISNSPSVGSSKPASMRSNVVLPQPDGPSSEKNSPRRMSNETSSTALTGPKCLETPWIEIMLSLMAMASECSRLAGLDTAAAQPLRHDHDNDRGREDGAAERQGWRQLVGKPQLAVEEHRQRLVGAAQEERHHELVERDGEAHQQAGDDAGQRDRESDAPERHPGAFAEIGGGLLQSLVEAFQAGDQH